MLRLRAFRPTSEKIVRLQLHPAHPWLVTADANDNVVVWDWEHRQVVYEFNAGRVDEKRLVGARLQKLAEGDSESKEKPTEAIRGGSVKQIKFYDDDVRFWQAWQNRIAAAEAPVAVNQQFTLVGGGHPATRGRHFLVICCENKAIFLDLVTMRGRDAPKQLLENKAPLCVEFLPRSGAGDGPFAAFGGSDGIIRVLSMNNWQIIQRYVGGHKGAVSCLITFVASSGETLLVSGSSDGFIVIWNGESPQAAREVSPKLSVKAHDGGVMDIQIARVQAGAPQLISIGADKTLAVWDTVSFKELRRVKPVSKVACQSVASWCHPRAPNLDILICVKDSHIWAIEHATYSAMTRDLCDLSSQVPTVLLTPNKKLKAYCMAVHPLQPHLVATGTNFGVILSEFDAKSIPAAVALPSPSGSKEHDVVFMAEREIRLLTFQISGPTDVTGGTGSVGEIGRSRSDSVDSAQLHVKQTRKRVATASYDSYSVLSVSSSGKYVSILWPDAVYFSIYRVSDWSMVDSGPAKYFAWDSCKDRYALLETVPAPKILPVVKSGSSRKAREAAAQAAAVAAAAAASAAASATVETRILLDDGSPNLLRKSIEGRSEQVIGLQGGSLLGVAYKILRGSTVSNSSTFSMDDGSSFLGSKAAADTQANFQLYSWESYKPVSGMLPQPEWSVWDQTVEYCAFAYQRFVVIASLRPQFRYLGNVAIGSATGGVWHRRQLYLATPTSIECVFVDAGVSAVDVERKKKKEEEKIKEAQVKAVAAQGELALLTVDAPHAVVEERVVLRPPMLQVVRLASFQTAPSVPLFLSVAKQSKADGDSGGHQKDVVERKVNDNAVAGGGISVAVSRLPLEQKRPIGPLLVVGVRDGVLWLVDRYMTAHAIILSHPGIRCRCLAAYGDAVSAVKWASRLGREHHDDLAQFMLGMGYATEALHLPGISKRLEYELAMQSGDLKRAFQCLTTLSNSKTVGQEIDLANDVTGILTLTTKETKLEAVQGISNFSDEFFKLIDAADATGQTEIAGEALKKLAAAGAVAGALQPREMRRLALRLATHGELTRLAVLINTIISTGHGQEAALAAALLGDSALLEKAWQDTNMFPEAALHAHAHGRPTLKVLLEQWNSTLQKDHGIKTKKLPTSAPANSLLSPQGGSIMQALSDPVKQTVIEVVPPGVVKPSNVTPLIGAPVNQNIAPGVVKPSSAMPLISAPVNENVGSPKQEPSQSNQLLLIEAAPLVSL